MRDYVRIERYKQIITTFQKVDRRRRRRKRYAVLSRTQERSPKRQQHKIQVYLVEGFRLLNIISQGKKVLFFSFLPFLFLFDLKSTGKEQSNPTKERRKVLIHKAPNYQFEQSKIFSRKWLYLGGGRWGVPVQSTETGVRCCPWLKRKLKRWSKDWEKEEEEKGLLMECLRRKSPTFKPAAGLKAKSWNAHTHTKKRKHKNKNNREREKERESMWFHAS